MKKYFGKLSVYFLLLLTALLGCNNEDDIVPQNPLVAVAGQDKSGKVNDDVVLDGSASYAKDNQPFAYSWTVTTKPQGSLAAFENSASAKPTFTPDKAGSYTIQLRIFRDKWFATDEVKLTVAADVPDGPTTVILHDNFSVDTTLMDIFDDPSFPDYIVTQDIEVRANLLLMPGVTIAFEKDKGLEIVSGSLRAIGNVTDRIVFKGMNDEPGFWKGIVVHTNSELNELGYVTITDGGSTAFITSNTGANVTLAGTPHSGAALKVKHSSFMNSGGYGLYVQGMSSLTSFTNNTFSDNALAAAYIPAARLHQLDSESFLGNNGTQVVETEGSVLTENNILWRRLTYLVTSDITIRAGITIEAGASFKFKEGTVMNVIENGFLYAAGTDASRITFTSATPNLYWNGLYFNSNHQQNFIGFAEISNGGFNRIADAAHEGNIVVGQNGTLTIENSIIKNGLGYGLVTKSLSSINSNVSNVNTFQNVQKGTIFPSTAIDLPPVTGVWLDRWSFNQGADNTVDNFYDKNTSTWFGGAVSPWVMNNAGFGIRIDENGNFTWTIAEHSPMTGCESYSAEYITGEAQISADKISFQQEYWRSKFINKCDPSQNVDIEVTTSIIELPYVINKMYNVLTGEEYWELKLTNPDNSTFSFYRR